MRIEMNTTLLVFLIGLITGRFVTPFFQEWADSNKGNWFWFWLLTMMGVLAIFAIFYSMRWFIRRYGVPNSMPENIVAGNAMPPN